jgi:hypothetical protein
MIGREVAKKLEKLPVGAGGRLTCALGSRGVLGFGARMPGLRRRESRDSDSQIRGRAGVEYWSCAWPRGIARHVDESRRGLRRIFWSRCVGFWTAVPLPKTASTVRQSKKKSAVRARLVPLNFRFFLFRG